MFTEKRNYKTLREQSRESRCSPIASAHVWFYRHGVVSRCGGESRVRSVNTGWSGLASCNRVVVSYEFHSLRPQRRIATSVVFIFADGRRSLTLGNQTKPICSLAASRKRSNSCLMRFRIRRFFVEEAFAPQIFWLRFRWISKPGYAPPIRDHWSSKCCWAKLI